MNKTRLQTKKLTLDTQTVRSLTVDAPSRLEMGPRTASQRNGICLTPGCLL